MQGKTLYKMIILTCQVFFFFFPQTISYVEENGKNISRIRQTRQKKSQFSRRDGKRQPANVENGGKIMVTWSLLPFAFHVKRDA